MASPTNQTAASSASNDNNNKKVPAVPVVSDDGSPTGPLSPTTNASPASSPPPAESSKVKMLLTLGNDVTLGSDYNDVTCEIRKNSVITPGKLVAEKVTKTRFKFCFLKDIWDVLELSEEQKLDVHLDRLSGCGSAKILKEKLDDTKEQVVLLYKVVSRKESVDDAVLSDIIDESKATHVVSSVEYGAQVIFLFEYETPRTSKGKNAIKLVDVVEKIPSIKALFGHSGPVKFTWKEKEMCKKITCKIFTDVPVTKERVTDFEEALKIYHKIPTTVNDDDHVALRMWLSEVHPETVTITDDILSRASGTVSKLTSFIAQCQDLLETEPMKSLARMRHKIHVFIEVVSMYSLYCKNDLVTKLEEVKSGAFGPGLVEKTVSEMESNPFNTDVLGSWLTEQEMLVKQLDKVRNQQNYKRRTMLVKTGESDDNIKKSISKYVAVFRLGLTSEEHQYLINMMQYLLTAEVSSTLPIDDDELKTLSLYSGSPTALNQKLRDFLSMVDDSQKTTLIITDDNAEQNHSHCGQMNIYENGILVHDNFVPPAKLAKPEFVQASHDGVKVRWDGHGTSGLDHYEVAYKQWYQPNWSYKRVPVNENQVFIDALRPGTMYNFKVRSVTTLGSTAFSPELKGVATLPCGPVAKPEARQISDTGCVVFWTVPSDVAQYRNSRTRGEAMRWEVEIAWDGGSTVNDVAVEKTTYHVDLEADKTYTFRIRSCTKILNPDTREKTDVKSHYSPQSDLFSLNATESDIVKNRAVLGSTLVRSSSPRMYDLNLRCEYWDGTNRLRKLSYGRRNDVAPMKTILVVGATGAGKSTLVNAFINYVMDVKWEDDCRFRLIQESLSANQAKSQTKWITAYILYHQKSFLVPYSLTIIDTPGFGDTSGIQADKEITDQLSAYFHGRGHEGIDCLDAIGFVVQASLPRLTPTQRYIFDSILALFGKDIADNIFMLITFADGQKPPVLQGLKEAQLPYTQAFKFNNSAIFAERQNDEHGSDSEDDEEESFDKMFWNMGAVSYRKFLGHLAKTKPKSLTLTNEVLDQRQYLEIHVTGIHEQIREGLGKLEELKAGLRCLSDHQADIDRNKDFVYTVNVQKTVKIDLQRGTYVTNCLTCNRTCHYPCGIPRDEDKHGCWAMDRVNNDFLCRICPTSCHWSVHVNTPYRYDLQDTIEKKTASDLKAQYESACKQKLTTEEVILKMVDDIDAREIYTASLTDEVRKSLGILNNIALKPCHLTTVDYIDVLIQSERSQALPGWQLRTRQLEAVRERAVTLNKVAQHRGVTEPWEEIRKAIKEEHEREKAGFFQSVADGIKKFFSKRI